MKASSLFLIFSVLFFVFGISLTGYVNDLSFLLLDGAIFFIAVSIFIQNTEKEEK